MCATERTKARFLLLVSFSMGRHGGQTHGETKLSVLWGATGPVGAGAAEERNLHVRTARRQQPCGRLMEGLGPLPSADPRCRPFKSSWKGRTSRHYLVTSSCTFALQVFFVPRNKYELSLLIQFLANTSAGQQHRRKLAVGNPSQSGTVQKQDEIK